MKRYKLKIEKINYPNNIIEEYFDSNKSRLCDFGKKLINDNSNYYFDYLISDRWKNKFVQRRFSPLKYKNKDKLLKVLKRKEKLNKLNYGK